MPDYLGGALDAVGILAPFAGPPGMAIGGVAAVAGAVRTQLLPHGPDIGRLNDAMRKAYVPGSRCEILESSTDAGKPAGVVCRPPAP